MKKIIAFLKDEKGLSSFLWLIPLLSIAALITAFCLGVFQVYSMRDKAVDSLSRSASISVGATEQDNDVRDLYFVVPEGNAVSALEENLILDGYTKQGEEWVYNDNFSLSDIEVEGNTEVLNIRATLNVNLKWHLDTSIRVVTVPISTKARVVYYNF